MNKNTELEAQVADSRTEETDQLRWKATDVDTLRTSRARRDPTGGRAASAADITSHKKNDTAFLDMAREWRRGDTKRRWRQGDRDLAQSRYKRRALKGHKRRSIQDQPQSLQRTSPRRSEGWNAGATPTWRQTAGWKKGRHPQPQR